MNSLYKISLIFACLVNLNIHAADWSWLNPLPASFKCISIKAVNVNTVYACGEAGNIIKTTNGGINWILLNSGTYYDLNKLEFINENTGWCAGGKNLNSIILKTTNGGANWINQLNAADTFYILQDIKFRNEFTGWTGGGYYSGRSSLLKTTNSGLNWFPMPTGTSLWVYSIEFLTEQNGFLAGNNFVLKTTDAGASWVQLSLPLTTYSDIEFINSATGWISGSSLHKTDNSGSSWTSIFSSSMGNIDFVTPDTGYSATSGIRRTINGGLNWEIINPGISESIVTVSFANTTTGWAAGWYGQILKTTNAGANWFTQKTDQISGGINDICMNNNKLWMAVNNMNNTGAVYSSTNMGVTWNQDLFLPLVFTSVYFSTIDTGWALSYKVSGNQLHLLKTVNGGANWDTYIILPYFLSTGKVFFRDSYTGYLTGNEWPGNFGRLLRTTNAGNNWNIVGGGEYVNDVKFVNDNTGIAVGSNGSVLRSTNSGANWFNAFSGVTYELRTVEFVNQTTGYAAGYGGIIKTTNAGVSWEVQSTANTYYMNTVKFFNSVSGIAAGFSGDILYTNNGGVNWLHYPNFTLTGFSKLYFINEATGWLGGSYGALLKTTNSGGVFLGITEPGLNTAGEFSLSQNYPNPFNPVTNIKFDIPNAGFVKLVIYDMLGREITLLVNEQMQPGSYNVDWDATAYPSGVYFYKIEVKTTDNINIFSESRKMVLVK